MEIYHVDELYNQMMYKFILQVNCVSLNLT